MRMTKPKLPMLLVLSGLFATVLVALRPLMPLDETRYLSVAWEMHLSGDPFRLTRNFEPYAHKPPLLFWVINLVWLVTGVSEFAARLVGPGFAVLCLWATARLGKALWMGENGSTAAMVLAGFSLFVAYGTATMFDAMLTVTVLLGGLCLWRACQSGGQWRDWAGLGMALGLGVLAKGPVVLLHLLPMVLMARFWAPDRPALLVRVKGMALALAVAVVLVALWLIPTLVTADAAFRQELLWTQSAARVQGGLRHDRPVWFLFALLPILLFPWGWVPGFWRSVPRAVKSDPAMRFLAIWVVSSPVMFSLIASKQLHYLLPELPAVALMIARLSGHSQVRRLSLAPWVGLGMAAVIALLAFVGAKGLPATITMPMLLALATAVAALSLAALRLPFFAGHLLLGSGLVAALLGIGWASKAFAPFDPRSMTAYLTRPADGLAVVGMPYNAEFNFVARLEKPVALPSDRGALDAWARAHPGGVIFGPVGQELLDVAPQAEVVFNRRRMGIWPASAAAGG